MQLYRTSKPLIDGDVRVEDRERDGISNETSICLSREVVPEIERMSASSAGVQREAREQSSALPVTTANASATKDTYEIVGVDELMMSIVH